MNARRRAARGFDHLAWLQSLPGDGPFLTLPILDEVFPNGLDPTDTDLARTFTQSYLDHRHAADADRTATAETFVTTVVTEVLGWGDHAQIGDAAARWAHTSAAHQVTTTPAFALHDTATPDDQVPLLLGFLWPPGTDLTGRTPGGWPASPIDRAAITLRHHGVPLGLVTDGRRFALLWAQRGKATGYVLFDTHAMLDDRVLLDAFTTLLSRRRFLAVAEKDTLLGLLGRSLDGQEEVTEELSFQVRKAVEILVDAFAADDRATGGQVLAGVDPDDVYRAAVTVVMRLVFLLAAEERRLLPADDALYASAYGIADLAERLIDRANDNGEEVLAHHTTAFPQVLATSRVLFEGVRHPALNIKGYGGSVFDPEAFPWLEGTQADGPGRPVRVDDRTMLHILRGLTRWQGRRLVYRTLDVEQIGYAYEGLLDHTAVNAGTIMLGLTGPKEPEVALQDLEEAAAKSPAQFDKWLKDRRGKAHTKTEAAFNPETLTPDQRRLLLSAAGGDEAVADRIAPWWSLLRTDERTGEPVVFLPGTLFVTASSVRGDSGAHYTPRTLAESVVKTTLDALVFDPGPIDTLDTDTWQVVTPQRIIDLKVADIAMGSGAFLVAAARYLADRLLESVAEADADDLVDPDLVMLRRILDTPPTPDAVSVVEVDEAMLTARRLVATRCLYGVDINPMAVEMAKLSLWLVTAAKDQPFGFLDHHLVVGDSLLGLHDMRQLDELDLRAGEGAPPRQIQVFQDAARETVARVAELRRQIAKHRVPDRRGVEEQQRLFAEAQALSADLAGVADALVGSSLASVKGNRGKLLDAHAAVIAEHARALFSPASSDDERAQGRQALRDRAYDWLSIDLPEGAFGRDPLHWPLVFPEVFAEPHPGFDAVIGNPPFLGGKRISGPLGSAYREHLVHDQGRGRKGNADLVAYMLLQAARLTRGEVGILATNTLAQGDTREVGLDALIADSWVVRDAIKSKPWPGAASLEYARICITRRRLEPPAFPILEGVPIRRADGAVGRIAATLDPAGRVVGKPVRLVANREIAAQGSIVVGTGFTLSQSEAAQMIAADPKNRRVLFPYLSGEDLNSSPTHTASRWIINFFDWDLATAESYEEPFRKVERDVKPERIARDATKDPKMVNQWWRYCRERRELYAAIEDLDKVIVVAQVSNTLQAVRVSTGQVLAMMLIVFASDSPAFLGLLSSQVHSEWVRKYAGTMRTDVRYTPSDVFETFPVPLNLDSLQQHGESIERARAAVMSPRNIGLTACYNLVNNPEVADTDVQALRDAHVALDVAVLDAYGWSEIDPEHGHYETAQGVRFTVSPAARDEILDRLLELNHARHLEEVQAGLVTPDGKPIRGAKTKKKPAAKKPSAGTMEGQGFFFSEGSSG